MTLDEALAILDVSPDPDIQLDNAIFVYRSLGVLIEQIKEVQSRAKDIATTIMYNNGQLRVVTPSGIATFTQPSVHFTWDGKALNALCASDDELDRILSPHCKPTPVASTLVIKGNNQ